MLQGCLSILAGEGFTHQHQAPQDDPVANAFEDKCFGFFDEVSPKPKAKIPRKRKTGLTQKRLDKMTLQCALVFRTHGVKDVHYNECLNVIRSAIADMLEVMGYSRPSSLCSTGPRWLCYRLWVKVAQEDGVSRSEIARNRAAAKRDHPRYYEAG